MLNEIPQCGVADGVIHESCDFGRCSSVPLSPVVSATLRFDASVRRSS